MVGPLPPALTQAGCYLLPGPFIPLWAPHSLSPFSHTGLLCTSRRVVVYEEGGGGGRCWDSLGGRRQGATRIS